MARLLRMPGIAANTHEAVLEQWALPLDAEFRAGDVLATVETEKAVVDIEADADGVLSRLLARPGETVTIGAPIAVIADPGEEGVDVTALLAESGQAQPANVAQEAPQRQPPQRQFASPLARRLAGENGLTIEQIAGTGPHGRVLRRDVEAAVSGRVPPADARVASPPQRPAGAAGSFTDIPHTQMRRTIAARLVESKQTVPHFRVHAVIRAARISQLHGLLRDQTPGISLTDLIVKAAARALRRVPDMNVIWTPDAVRRFDDIDVGLAVAVDGGLLTPVIRNADARTLSAVAADRRDLVDRARQRRLAPAEIVGGTMTVSSLGMHGVTEFDAIINPPQSAILAVGAIHDAVIAEDGHAVVAPVLKVTLSADHRPVDGVVAATWMREFVRLIEEPALFLS